MGIIVTELFVLSAELREFNHHDSSRQGGTNGYACRPFGTPRLLS